MPPPEKKENDNPPPLGKFQYAPLKNTTSQSNSKQQNLKINSLVGSGSEDMKWILTLIANTPMNQIFLSLLFQNALRGETGTRKKNLSKHLICGKTAKTYLFWDNLMYHYKNLAPLYGKKIEFKVNS